MASLTCRQAPLSTHLGPRRSAATPVTRPNDCPLGPSRSLPQQALVPVGRGASTCIPASASAGVPSSDSHSHSHPLQNNPSTAAPPQASPSSPVGVSSSGSAPLPPSPGNLLSLPADPPPASPSPPGGLWARLKRYFVGDKADKEKLAALGMGAFLAYGSVSNVTYGTCLTIAWITMVKTTGYSPLMLGKWPVFLGYYAGMWAVQNFLRPLRIPLAIAMAPPFEAAMQAISQRTGLKKRWAFGIMLACVAVTTLALLGSALLLLGGFPPVPPELLTAAAPS